MAYWYDGYCCSKYEWVSHILFRKVEVKHFISEMTHKPNVLRFWIKMLCPTHLYSCSYIQYGWFLTAPHGDPESVVDDWFGKLEAR
jgi:hypothetical protein